MGAMAIGNDTKVEDGSVLTCLYQGHQKRVIGKGVLNTTTYILYNLTQNEKMITKCFKI